MYRKTLLTHLGFLNTGYSSRISWIEISGLSKNLLLSGRVAFSRCCMVQFYPLASSVLEYSRHTLHYQHHLVEIDTDLC